METAIVTKPKEDAPLIKCCNTCPFLAENADKPNPEGWIPDESIGQTHWYTQKTLNHLWKEGLRKGQEMVCHSHDPSSHEYGGKGCKNEQPKMCMGAAMMQFKHANRFSKLLEAEPGNKPRKAYSKYKMEFGKHAMTFDGITNVCIWFAIGRTDLMGGLPVPRESAETRPFREIK